MTRMLFDQSWNRWAVALGLLMLGFFSLSSCSIFSGSGAVRTVDLTDPATLREIAVANGYAVTRFADAAEENAAQAYRDSKGHDFSVAYGISGNEIACFSQVEPGRINAESMAMFDDVVCRRTYGLRYRVFDDANHRLECW